MTTAKDVEGFSREELCEYVEKQLELEAVDIIRKNRLSGASFLQLTCDHLKEMFPVIGDRIPVTRLLDQLRGCPQSSSKSATPAKVCCYNLIISAWYIAIIMLSLYETVDFHSIRLCI